MSLDHDTAVRLAAFAALARLERRHGPVLPWDVISQGFDLGGKHYLFANRARGIFRPQGMDGPALSIKTTIPRVGRQARYDDSVDGGTLAYRFHGTDPEHLDNRLLLAAMRQGAPLIYFAGVAPSRYSPLWPAYVTAFKPEELTCEVQIDERRSVDKHFGAVVAAERSLVRRYATVEARRRLHQDAFRVVVLDAYRQRSAVCRSLRSWRRPTSSPTPRK
jgi:putative restriction endonuclease